MNNYKAGSKSKIDTPPKRNLGWGSSKNKQNIFTLSISLYDNQDGLKTDSKSYNKHYISILLNFIGELCY